MPPVKGAAGMLQNSDTGEYYHSKHWNALRSFMDQKEVSLLDSLLSTRTLNPDKALFPLHFASAEGDLGAIKKLFAAAKARPDINQQFMDLPVPLICASTACACATPHPTQRPRIFNSLRAAHALIVPASIRGRATSRARSRLRQVFEDSIIVSKRFCTLPERVDSAALGSCKSVPDDCGVSGEQRREGGCKDA
jgi:hypothetical protein